MLWAIGRLAAHHKQPVTNSTLKHQPNLHTLTYMSQHPMVHSVLNLAGLAALLNPHTTTMSAPLRPVVAQRLTKLLLPSLSPGAISPGAGRARSLCTPMQYGLVVVKLPSAATTQVHSVQTLTTMALTAGIVVRVRPCWRSPQGSNG